MPNLAFYHPQIVHFVLALLGAGVLLRWMALTGKWPWTSPAAAALLLAGTLAAVAAVKSGTDAHGPVERIPGARTAATAMPRQQRWAAPGGRMGDHRQEGRQGGARRHWEAVTAAQRHARGAASGLSHRRRLGAGQQARLGARDSRTARRSVPGQSPD